MSQPITFFVPGIPQPKGSSKAFASRHTGKIIVQNANKKSMPWQNQVSWEANERRPETPWLGPMSISLEFTFTKPPTSKRQSPTVRPDLDKLARNILDSLEKIFYHNDAQVTALFLSKAYADAPGVLIGIREVGEIEQKHYPGGTLCHE